MIFRDTGNFAVQRFSSGDSPLRFDELVQQKRRILTELQQYSHPAGTKAAMIICVGIILASVDIAQAIA